MSGPHEQLVELLREVHSILGRHFKDVLSAHNLTPPAILICNQLRLQPGITVSEAARRTGIAKSHVSKIIRDLEQRGWVIRENDLQDQRLSRLYTSDPGKVQLTQVRNQILVRLNDLVADIPDRKAAALVDGLIDIRNALQRCSPKETP